VCPHIHKIFYEKSNPDANIIYADGREYYLPDPYSSHKVKSVNSNNDVDVEKFALVGGSLTDLQRVLVVNHDKYLREWLRDNFHRITTDNIAFYEWDVLLNKTLPCIEVDAIHVRISHDMHPSLRKVAKFNKNISRGMAPFGAFYANKYFIEQMIDVKYDYLYDQDLFCEARLVVLADLTQTRIIQDKQIMKSPPPLLRLTEIKENLIAGGIKVQEIPEECLHPIKQNLSKLL